MAQHLPYDQANDDRALPAAPGARPDADRPGPADAATTPGRDALKALVRLLARQAAREHVRSQD